MVFKQRTKKKKNKTLNGFSKAFSTWERPTSVDQNFDQQIYIISVHFEGGKVSLRAFIEWNRPNHIDENQLVIWIIS